MRSLSAIVTASIILSLNRKRATPRKPFCLFKMAGEKEAAAFASMRGKVLN